MKKQIPNALTLLNLVCGALASLSIFEGNYSHVAGWILLGGVLDFWDGFLARRLGSDRELGKQLDSLADVVTFGLVPGLVMRRMLLDSLAGADWGHPAAYIWVANLGLLITAASALRLAKFNLNASTDHFVGLPTPANTFFIVSLWLAGKDYSFLGFLLDNTFFLLLITGLSCWMMNARVKLIALKFKTLKYHENRSKYALLICSVALIAAFTYFGVALSIILYIFMSARYFRLVSKA